MTQVSAPFFPADSSTIEPPGNSAKTPQAASIDAPDQGSPGSAINRPGVPAAQIACAKPELPIGVNIDTCTADQGEWSSDWATVVFIALARGAVLGQGRLPIERIGEAGEKRVD